MLNVALFNHLKNNVAVASLVALPGNKFGIYPIRLPQDPTFPCLSYQLITEPTEHSLDGFASPNAIVQIDCWSKTLLQASQLAQAVNTALDSFRGALGGTLTVSQCTQRNRQELYESANDIGEFRVLLEYSIWYN